jgi:hypothetical protein
MLVELTFLQVAVVAVAMEQVHNQLVDQVVVVLVVLVLVKHLMLELQTQAAAVVVGQQVQVQHLQMVAMVAQEL